MFRGAGGEAAGSANGLPAYPSIPLEMERKMTALKEFYDWVRTKSGPYEITDNTCCPMAEFGREVRGLQHPRARTGTIDEASDSEGSDILKHEAVDFGYPIYGATIAYYPHSYEALAERMALRYGRIL